METRSKRQQTTTRPAYPQISTCNVTSPSPSATRSAASSAFQSSSSLTSYPSPRAANSGDAAQAAMYTLSPTYGSSGPLPSPLAQQSSHYFGSIASNATGAHHAHHMQSQSSSHASSTRGPQMVQQQQFAGQRGGAGGGAPETAPFLSNFNLVAEAAKRAQMDCLMRDLNDVEL